MICILHHGKLGTVVASQLNTFCRSFAIWLSRVHSIKVTNGKMFVVFHCAWYAPGSVKGLLKAVLWKWNNANAMGKFSRAANRLLLLQFSFTTCIRNCKMMSFDCIVEWHGVVTMFNTRRIYMTFTYTTNCQFLWNSGKTSSILLPAKLLSSSMHVIYDLLLLKLTTF